MKYVLTILYLIGLIGCATVSDTTNDNPVDISEAKDLSQFVGQFVVVKGTVTNTKCPQVNGIDLWNLDEHRGKLVEVKGYLFSSTITAERIRILEDELGGMFANRGEGTFFHLKGMSYKILQNQHMDFTGKTPVD